MYVDGKSYASVNISKQKGSSIDVYDFVLGADGMKSQGVTDSWIDELYVYKRVLSQDEIQDYNAPFILQKLIAEYEHLADESTASQEKTDAFRAAIAEVKQAAEGVTDLEVIEELTNRLKDAFNSFMSPEEGIINFEVISDVHIASTDPNHAHAVQFKDMLSDMTRDYPDSAVILNCGDFTENGTEAQAAIYFDTPLLLWIFNAGDLWRTGCWTMELHGCCMLVNGKRFD